jgi:hypothetical protein
MSTPTAKPETIGAGKGQPPWSTKGQASGTFRVQQTFEDAAEGRPFRLKEKGCFAVMDVESGLLVPQVVLDEEFQRLLPVPTEAEWQALEKEVAEKGECPDPVVVWKETLVLLDGYPRLEVCRRLGLPYGVTELSFPDRESAKEWFLSCLTGQQPVPAPDFVIRGDGLPPGKSLSGKGGDG